MRTQRLSVFPLALLTILAVTGGRPGRAQHNSGGATRLVVFEDFMRPT